MLRSVASRVRGARETGVVFRDVSRTVQSEERSANINFIFERLVSTGVMPVLNRQELTGDYSYIGEFQDLQDRVLEGVTAFNALPAKLRDRFGNEPAKFMDFMMDAANIDEMRKLGLVDPKAEVVAPAV